ncbi:MAG: YpbF family protein [Alphaproteobacteria bacterium]|nr:YpbF family protein [Alphaproteobacteria bacterium]
MFDLIFSVLEAWNALGLMLMASVFLLIGGGMLAHHFYWRFCARRIEGRVVGLRVVQTSKWEAETPDSEGQNSHGALLVFGFFFILFPLIFGGIGAWFAYGYYDLTTNGMYADAVVVRNETTTDSDGDSSNSTVIRFTDRKGESREVKDSISYGGAPSYDEGQGIGVYYDPDDPEWFVIADFWHNMGIAIAFMGFSVLFILIFCLIFFFSRRKGSIGSGGAVATQDAFYPVYEYHTPQGERAEYVDSVGTGAYFLHTLPGTRARLLMFPGHPPKVKKASLVWLVLGLIFLLPGLFIGYVAVSQFRFSLGMIALLLAGVGFAGYQLMLFLEKIPKAEREKGWKAFRSGEFLSNENFTITMDDASKKGRLMTPEEIRTGIPKQRRAYRISGLIMLLIGLGLGAGSYYAGESMLALSQNGIRTGGEVVDLRSKSTDDGYVYHAVVRFKDLGGQDVRFEDSVGASSPTMKRKDQVQVLYPPDRPKDAIIDRGIFNWSLSGGLAAGAFLFLLGAFSSLRTAARAGRMGAFRTAL